MSSHLKAVIFDMDGLMLDTERLAMQAVRSAAARYGATVTDDMIMRLVGLNEEDAYLLLKNELGFSQSPEIMGKAYLEEYTVLLKSEGIVLKKGLLTLFDFLASRRIKCAVATMTHTELAHQKLSHVGILDRFQNVVGRDQVEKGKPAPDAYLKAMALLGVEPEVTLALEDSDYGAQAALSAKIPVIVVPDLKQPSEEIRRKSLAVMGCLDEVRAFLELSYQSRNE